MNYYNEIDPFAAEWLRQLIKAGHIAPGEVDTRSIEDVHPGDLHGFTQCHFFAGIGGWSYALRQAGWPDDRPVWTGSCPCQPFSAAGKRGGTADERHLWPAFFHLIAESAPGVLFGEQVASKDGLSWFDTVQADLESAAYACWAWDLCAAGIGAPHIRQRLYFVADSRPQPAGRGLFRSAESFSPDVERASDQLERPGVTGELDNATNARHDRAGQCDGGPSLLAARPEQSGTYGFYTDVDWLPCIDGKARPVEPGTFPLAHGVPNRVGRLRGYGNAIVAPLAQAFIEAYIDVTK